MRVPSEFRRHILALLFEPRLCSNTILLLLWPEDVLLGHLRYWFHSRIHMRYLPQWRVEIATRNFDKSQSRKRRLSTLSAERYIRTISRALVCRGVTLLQEHRLALRNQLDSVEL